jgi:hypothetical protein
MKTVEGENCLENRPEGEQKDQNFGGNRVKNRLFDGSEQKADRQKSRQNKDN